MPNPMPDRPLAVDEDGRETTLTGGRPSVR